METETLSYQLGSQSFLGFIAKPHGSEKRPAVMVVHDWGGCGDFAKERARALADLGYVGFAIDMYGEGRTYESVEEKMAMMTPLTENRAFIFDRMQAAWSAIAKHPSVDANKIAVIGYCFGGMCALDLARSGVAIAGAVSFHGLLAAPERVPVHSIKAKILVLHGYSDPMVKPQDVMAFCDEMTQAHVDWQINAYGHAQHAFANPHAHDAARGIVYQEAAAKRSWAAMTYFLQEILG